MAKFKCNRCGKVFTTDKPVRYYRCQGYWYWRDSNLRKIVLRCECGTVNIKKI